MNKKEPIKTLAIEDLMLVFRRKIRETMRKDNLKEELTMSQVEVLKMIGTKDSHTMKDISKALQISPPSATELINELVKKGFIVRETHPNDRRIVSVRLTKKSQDIFSRVSIHKKTVIDNMLSVISAKDKKTLERIINLIISK